MTPLDRELTTARMGERAGAGMIDVIPVVLVAILFGWVPILGAMIAGFFIGSYWMLRDVTGASLGKLMLGLRVASRDGERAGVGRRILRNIPLAAGPFLLMIPILGYAMATVVAGCIFLVEIILVMTQGERLGDRLANTIVIRRA